MMRARHRFLDFKGVLQGLGADKAVKGIGRQGGRVGQIADDGGGPIPKRRMLQGIERFHLPGGKFSAVAAVPDFKDLSPDQASIPPEKILNVVTVYRRSPIPAKVGVYRKGSGQVRRIHGGFFSDQHLRYSVQQIYKAHYDSVL